MRRYFELLYDVQELDKKQILPRLNRADTGISTFPFREVAGDFRFIEDETIGVIVPIEPEAEALVRELRYTGIPTSDTQKVAAVQRVACGPGSSRAWMRPARWNWLVGSSRFCAIWQPTERMSGYVSKGGKSGNLKT